MSLSDIPTLAGRLLGSEARSPTFDDALRRWFASAGEIPAAALAASSPEQLLEACEALLRPRAIELCELLELRGGNPPPRRSRERQLWVMLDRGGDAIALRLHAWRVDGIPGLAADAGLHGEASRDQDYRRAEAAASRTLERTHPGVAVRYSLTRADGEAFTDSIGDGSFGAALGVIAVSVAGRPSPLALDQHGAITGALTSDDRLGPVEQVGLRGKAIAAQRAGARRLIVPPTQAGQLGGVAGIRIREASTVAEARRRLRILHPLARAGLLLLLALVVAGGLLVHELRSGAQRGKQRDLAVERAMSNALSIAASNPRAALQISAAAAQLDPRQTASARSLLAASLPPGVQFLPALPAPATALSWTATGIVAATAKRIYRLAPDRSRWLPGPSVPSHRLAAFDRGGRLVIGGHDGAWLITHDERRRLTRQPIREVAGGGAILAVLTQAGKVTVAKRGGAAEVPVEQPVDTWSVDRVTQIAVTPSGELVAGDDLGRILRRKGESLRIANQAPISPRLQTLVALAAEGDHVVAAGAKGTIFARDAAFGDAFGPIEPPMTAMVALPDHRGVALRRDSTEVFVVDDDYLGIHTEQRLGGVYRAAAVSPDGRHLIVAGRQAALLRLDSSLPSPYPFTQTVAFSRSNRLLGIPSEFGGALRLRPDKPSIVVPGVERPVPLSPATVSPNGRWAAQAEPQGKIRLLDLQSGRARTFSARYATYDARIEGFFVFPGVLDDGRLALSVDSEDNDEFDGTTYLVDPDKRRARRLDYPGAGPFARALPPGRLLLASGDHLDLVRLRDMARAASVTVPGAYINTIAASTSGRHIYFGTSSGDIWSWSPSGDEGPVRLGQVDGALHSLVSNRNGSVLFGTATSGLRESARFFAVDVPSHRVQILEVPENGPVAEAALSPDQRLVAVSAGNPIGAELLSARLTPAEACAHAGGDVSAAAWRRAVGGLPVAAPSCPAP